MTLQYQNVASSPTPSRTILPVWDTPVCCHEFGCSKFSHQAFAQVVLTDSAKLAISYPLCLSLKVTALESVPLIINLAPPIIFCLSPYTFFVALIRIRSLFLYLIFVSLCLQCQLQEGMDFTALSLLFAELKNSLDFVST